MGIVKPIPFETPDGIQRELRFTVGARARIAERFGSPDIADVLNKRGDGAISGLLFACMYDAKGQPPEDLTEAALAEQLPGDDMAALFAMFFEAITQGRQLKKDLEAMFAGILQQSAGERTGKTDSSGSGAVPPTLAVPASRTSNSGTGSRKRKSKHASMSGSTDATEMTTAPESSPPPSAT